jgi:DNA polymerase/3'-5' exonuclease PolX
MNPADRPSNKEIADLLDRVAALLEAQDGSPYRVQAYRIHETLGVESLEDLEAAAHDGRLACRDHFSVAPD